jgi:hypothetical protein
MEIDIDLKSLKIDRKIKSISNIPLINEMIFKSILIDSLNNHPLDKQLYLLDKLTIKVDVIIDGDEITLLRNGGLAKIIFENFIKNPSNPIKLILHYGCYLGIDPDVLEKNLIDRYESSVNIIYNNKEYAYLRNYLEKKYDKTGIQRILLHEFSHLIDALSPSFGYSNEKYLKIKKSGLDVNFTHLWNCYINRRLNRQSPYSFPKPNVSELKEKIDAIYKTQDHYTFDQLRNLLQ